MTDRRSRARARSAPWWAYVVSIVAVNYLRQALVPPGQVGDVVSVALFAATTVAVAVVVSLLYRRGR